VVPTFTLKAQWLRNGGIKMTRKYRVLRKNNIFFLQYKIFFIWVYERFSYYPKEYSSLEEAKETIYKLKQRRKQYLAPEIVVYEE